MDKILNDFKIDFKGKGCRMKYIARLWAEKKETR